jgi:hypothetical protein
MADAKKTDEKDHEENPLVKVQRVIERCNEDPNEDFVIAHEDGFVFLPISHIEMMLDEIFYGHWSVRGFIYEAVQNELLGSLEVEVIHPVTAAPIVRAGAGAVTIMKGTVTNLSLDLPRLKVECIKNAVQSLGKCFGRDLNREILDSYEPPIKPPKDEKKDKLIDKVTKVLDAYEGKDRDEIRAECVARMESESFTNEFAEEMLKRMS